MARRAYHLMCLFGLLVARTASADRNDLTLERVVGKAPANLAMYQGLVHELAVAVAPRPITPADTLGYSGFQIDVDTALTGISSSADFWQRGAERVTPGTLSTLTVMARKGIWVPAPSCEIGMGGTKLLLSNLFTLQGYLKLAVYEGFHKRKIPSFALRIAASHLFGSSQVALTSLVLDLTTSKRFAVRGTVKLDPYLGFASILTFVQGGVIDATPNVDAYKQGPGSIDLQQNTSFADPGTLLRWRVFTGLRLIYTIASFTLDVAYIPPADRAGSQFQLSLATGLVF